MILIGYGKMGKEIEALLEPQDEVIARIDVTNSSDLGPRLYADVAIEFTGPGSAVNNIIRCLEMGIPLVCGSTGWYDRLPEVKQSCTQHNGSLIYAPNFSIGVNIFFELNRRLAVMMRSHGQYDVTINETHHIHKKDAPSGTAIKLAEDVLLEAQQKQTWVNHTSGTASELIVLSRREGEVPGTHNVRWFSDADEITVEHKAHSRRGFAEGAIAAARWIIGKKGVFTMTDLLNLNA